jgi:hypothetical protein
MSRPPERSVYRKIAAILEAAKSGKLASTDDVVASIRRREPLDFTYYRIDQFGHAKVTACSEQSIKRCVEICQHLGFLDASGGKLTKSGIRAMDGRHFDGELRTAVGKQMDRLGVPMERISATIRDMFHDVAAERIPTWDGIHHELAVEVPRDTFKLMLTLLSQSDGIAWTRKKIYLPRS